MLPTTRYAKSGDIHVAYQVFGDGEIDLVFFPGFVSNIEIYWEEPHFARWLRKLASFSRVITFDKRGTGLSDRLEILPTMDERMDDVRAVMDAAGSERAAVFGLSEGGSLATLFAAHYPERCRALVLWGAFATWSRCRRPATNWLRVIAMGGFTRWSHCRALVLNSYPWRTKTRLPRVYNPTHGPSPPLR